MHDDQKGTGVRGRGTESISKAVIDDAAYALTRGEPSPRLRHAVRARIEKRPTAWLIPMWIPALAGAAVLVIAAVLVARTLSGPRGVADPTRPSAASQVARVAPPTPRMALPDVTPPTFTEPPQQSSAARTERVERPNESNEPNDVDASAHLIEPIEILPLELPQLAVGTSSGVMPIEIDPLQIEPLQPQ